ncbi:glycine--tRNA ligase subunit beta [Schleiferilactobacillus perolens]|uniref:Glycine--tRNA ligase beta subunit n=1 Tax=Schleiferilactobacillus perolens DSM 12744 TaxID=1423792 RepID=A0A0R1N015_9LACO|nr:glycine--tRNA ligase subunit beta [Schleiferilactobacillus perolens]KRL13113.1 glycine--tRNA ligase [Schleiferilactobacillus perolens DSM 12744]
MTTHNYLLEIGLEDMPAHVVTPSIHQLRDRMAAFLKDNRLAFADIHEYATPRRLALLVSGLADKQTDESTENRGPAMKIAQDKDGQWTKAAQGFARGQGGSVDDLEVRDVKGTPYVFYQKNISGQPAAQVLPKVTEIIEAMTFPTRMHWNSYDFEYIRPLHWFVSLLDDTVIPFKVLDIEAGRTTQGHRFLGEPVALKNATDYETALAKQFVIADEDKRGALIKDQVTQIANDHGWRIVMNRDLFEEVTNLVEYPTAFAGKFDKKYLELPDAVLITSMRDNQRYFYVTDHNGELLPDFVAVRNGNTDHLENVIKGNEKVLVARLEDAVFFYEEDQQHTIADYVEKLKTVMFHDKIGTMYEKMQRVAGIAHYLGERFELSDEELTDLDRAAHIYKFDLVTSMVGEFPELQGTMGEIYAQLQGEKPAVAQAIREHYMPTSADGKLPESKIGSVLAIADKMDTIMTFFGAGMVPSGSNDPYALRRQAYGIIRILQEHRWHFPLLRIQAAIVSQFQKKNQVPQLKLDKIKGLNDFFVDRVKQFFSTKDARHDIVDAVTENQEVDPEDMFAAAQVLTHEAKKDTFKGTIEALTRVSHLARKAKDEEPVVDPALFQNPSEQKLYDAVEKLKVDVPNLSIGDLYQRLQELRPIIDAYFDENMVMDKDPKIQNNRLQQLRQIREIAKLFGNLDGLIVK